MSEARRLLNTRHVRRPGDEVVPIYPLIDVCRTVPCSDCRRCMACGACECDMDGTGAPDE